MNQAIKRERVIRKARAFFEAYLHPELPMNELKQRFAADEARQSVMVALRKRFGVGEAYTPEADSLAAAGYKAVTQAGALYYDTATSIRSPRDAGDFVEFAVELAHYQRDDLPGKTAYWEA